MDVKSLYTVISHREGLLKAPFFLLANALIYDMQIPLHLFAEFVLDLKVPMKRKLSLSSLKENLK